MTVWQIQSHGGLEGVSIGPAHLVLLLHLNGIPALDELQFAVLETGRFGAHGEDAAINAVIAYFGFFGMPPRAMAAQF